MSSDSGVMLHLAKQDTRVHIATRMKRISIRLNAHRHGREPALPMPLEFLHAAATTENLRADAGCASFETTISLQSRFVFRVCEAQFGRTFWRVL
eukprot:6192465-Pleurochrysis_carterae.AAC.1